MPRDLIFDRFRRNIMAGTQNNEILDSSNDPPVSRVVHLPLVAGVEPAVPQHIASFRRPVPILRKNIRPAYNDLLALAQLHFNSTDRRSHPSRLDLLWIIHGTDRGSFRQPIDL